MMHSKKYETVKKWYSKGIWTVDMVRNAVIKEWITADEFTEITGQEYEG